MMACEVTRSPYAKHMLTEGWNAQYHRTGLDAIADSNANPGDKGNEALTSVSSPVMSKTALLARRESFSHPFKPQGMDETLSQQLSSPLHEFNSSGLPGTSRGYYQSIDFAYAQQHISEVGYRDQTNLRSDFQPLNDFNQDQCYVQREPEVTFHRDGHYLGDPRPKSPKCRPRSKRNTSSHPYSKPKRIQATGSQEQQARYLLRDARTQTVRPRPPKSTPAGISHSKPHQYQFSHDWIHMQHPAKSFVSHHSLLKHQQFVGSRVCTPTGRTLLLATGQMIDPTLGHIPGPLPPISLYDISKTRVVTVPLSVEELKAIITEAVQSVVKGSHVFQKVDIRTTTDLLACNGEFELELVKEEHAERGESVREEFFDTDLEAGLSGGFPM